jgi:Zn-dependent protease
MGWFGGAYLLAFGITYPIIRRVSLLSTGLSDYFKTELLRLSSILIFGVGSLCSYQILSARGVLVGRLLVGLGAAGLFPGLRTDYVFHAVSALCYIIGRFIGPL